MTREEAQDVMAYIEAVFGDLNVDATLTVNLWVELFEEFSGREVKDAVTAYIKHSGSAFAPKPPQVFEYLYKPRELTQMNDQEAWGLVMKAIKNSSYHAKEEFEKLPVDVQKAVGAPSQLETWAKSDDFNSSVQESLFSRTYNQVLKNKEYIVRITPRMDRKEQIEMLRHVELEE